MCSVLFWGQQTDYHRQVGDTKSFLPAPFLEKKIVPYSRKKLRWPKYPTNGIAYCLACCSGNGRDFSFDNGNRLNRRWWQQLRKVAQQHHARVCRLFPHQGFCPSAARSGSGFSRNSSNSIRLLPYSIIAPNVVVTP